jgi:hypothetical protein
LTNKLLIKEREDNTNTEENNDIIKKSNNENSKKFNPSDDKYENFDLYSMEQRFLYTTKYPNEEKVLILNDSKSIIIS